MCVLSVGLPSQAVSSPPAHASSNPFLQRTWPSVSASSEAAWLRTCPGQKRRVRGRLRTSSGHQGRARASQAPRPHPAGFTSLQPPPGTAVSNASSTQQRGPLEVGDKAVEKMSLQLQRARTARPTRKGCPGSRGPLHVPAPCLMGPGVHTPVGTFLEIPRWRWW